MFLAKDGDVDDHWIWFLLENGHDWVFQEVESPDKILNLSLY